MSAEEEESGSTPAEVIEVVGKTGMHGEAMQVKCRSRRARIRDESLPETASGRSAKGTYSSFFARPPVRRTPSEDNNQWSRNVPATTRAKIEPGTGIMYVQKDGTVLHFVDSKAEKNFKLGREPRDLEWTEDGRRGKGPA